MCRRKDPGKGAKINILPGILKYIKNLFDFKNAPLSVELGEDVIKIAEASAAGKKAQTLRFFKGPAGRDGKDPSDDIRALAQSLGIAGREVNLNIPRYLATVRFLKLPSTDDEEISKMVKMEALKHVPYSDEDIVSGYRVIERTEEGYSRVLIAVMKADAVLRRVDILRNAGLPVASVSLGSEALLLWRQMACAGAEDENTLLVNIDSDHIDIDVVSKGRLIFTRGVLYGASDKISAENIAGQINMSLAAFKKESRSQAQKIVLTGAAELSANLKGLLDGKIGIPVEVAGQLNNMPASATEEPAADSSFAELIASVLNRGGLSVNLLPEDVRSARRMEESGRNLMLAGVVLALIAVLSGALMLKKLHDKKLFIERLDDEIAAIEPVVKKAKIMAKEINMVASGAAEKPLAIDLASDIFKVTPPGISLTLMEYEKGKSVSLRGTAPSLSEIFKYVTILEKTDHFENVKVKYANKRTGQAAEAADFEIACPVAGSRQKKSGA